MLNSRSKSCFAPCTHSSGSLDTKRSSTLSGSWSSSGQSWLKYAPRNCARSGKSSLVKAVRIPYESDNRRETADFSSIQGERRLRLEGFQLGEISSNWLRELGGNFNTGFVAKQSVGDLRLISSDRSEGSPLGCRSVIERGGPRSRFVRGGTRRQLSLRAGNVLEPAPASSFPRPHEADRQVHRAADRDCPPEVAADEREHY